MNDTATKWHAQRAVHIHRTEHRAEDLERKGLAAMTDGQAEQSYHRWRKFVKTMQMARGGK